MQAGARAEKEEGRHIRGRMLLGEAMSVAHCVLLRTMMKVRVFAGKSGSDLPRCRRMVSPVDALLRR